MLESAGIPPFFDFGGKISLTANAPGFSMVWRRFYAIASGSV
jgi:hypothetical protein